MDVFKQLKQELDSSRIPKELHATLTEFFGTYRTAALTGGSAEEEINEILLRVLQRTLYNHKHPHPFESFHKRDQDDYALGLDFWRRAIDLKHSILLGHENVVEMQAHIDKHENVVLFGNHQTEPDPHIISLLIEKEFPQIAEDIIFVAGARVTSDPVAAPFSLGRNLLCIHSKRHLSENAEIREEQLRANQRTMKRMAELLAEGGQCIYVAPSGGRDRMREGKVDIAPFDGQSLEMFLLMAQKAGTPTHFYPLSLATYHRLPPPPTVIKQLGESRVVGYGPVGAKFGKEILLDQAPGQDLADKKERRAAKADWMWRMVVEGCVELEAELA